MMNPQERFHANVLWCAQYCGNIVTDAYNQHLSTIMPVFVKASIVYIENKFTPDQMIVNFIDNSYTYWEQIRNRNETFFDEHMHEIFGGFSSEANTVNLFRDLFNIKRNDGTLFITEKQKNTIWDCIDAFVKISIQYIHLKRIPIGRDEHTKKIIYKNSLYFPEIDEDLEALAKHWNILLDVK